MLINVKYFMLNYKSTVQCGHFVALILIAEKHLGQVFVSITPCASFLVSTAALNLLINLMSKNTAKATNIKLIRVFMKRP